jgi:hypothetical protein
MFKSNLLALSLCVATGLMASSAQADTNGGGESAPQLLYQTPGVLPAGFAPYLGVANGGDGAAFLTNDYTRLEPGITTKNVHWAGADAKLSPAQLNSYVTGHGQAWGPLL